MRSLVLTAATAAAGALLLAARSKSRREAHDLAAEAEEAAEAHPIYSFVLTGGPCAGKTTAMARLSTFLRERGFRVFTVPEAATMLFTNGATFRDLETEEGQMNFQIQLMSLQLFLEDTYRAIASNTGRPAVLLCDRGAMDGSAYISDETWNELLRQTGRDVVQLREGRYNAVFHLVTAALGAEQFYTLENNVARLETVDEARDLDQRLRRGWVGHPQLFVFDNSSDFEGKMQRLVAQAGALVGLPSSSKKTHAYILSAAPDLASFPVHVERFEVEKVYLLTKASSTAGPAASDEYTFVRRRSQNGLAAFGQTTVRIVDGEQVEVKRIISSREYAYAVAQRADPSRHVVRQARYSFLWEDKSFQVHQYQTPRPGLCVLHCQESASGAGVTDIPPFLEVLSEADPVAHSAYRISLKSAPQGSPPASPAVGLERSTSVQ